MTITNIEIQCFLGKKCIGLKKLFTQHIIGDHIIQSQIDYQRLSKWVDIKAIKIGLFRKAPLLFIHIQKVGSNWVKCMSHSKDLDSELMHFTLPRH